MERLLQSNYHPASEITPSATYFPIRPAHSTRWPLLLCPFPASIFLHLPIDFLFADFVISSFFSGVGGALFAMFANNAQAKVYTSTMTYEILLIVVIGGIGSISGSCLATFLYVACAEWWLRFLDSPMTFTSVTDTRRILFILVFAALVIGGALLLIRRERRTTKKVWKELLVSLAALALLVWLAFFIISGSLTVPLLRTGFRMVVFSVIIMIVVLFFRRGIMGDKEFSDILFARRKASGKGAVK